MHNQCQPRRCTADCRRALLWAPSQRVRAAISLLDCNQNGQVVILENQSEGVVPTAQERSSAVAEVDLTYCAVAFDEFQRSISSGHSWLCGIIQNAKADDVFRCQPLHEWQLRINHPSLA